MITILYNAYIYNKERESARVGRVSIQHLKSSYLSWLRMAIRIVLQTLCSKISKLSIVTALLPMLIRLLIKQMIVYGLKSENRGDFLLKSCLKNIQRFLSKPVKFVTVYDSKRLSVFVSNKDKLPPLFRSNIACEVACPGCGKTYIGMTRRRLSVRLKGHSTRLSSCAMTNISLNVSMLIS